MDVGISLGGCCLPAVWGVHHKYRGRKIDHHKSCPFDQMIINYNTMVKCIVEDFKHFADPSYLMMAPINSFKNHRDCVSICYPYDTVLTNTYYGCGFQHETPAGNLYQIESWKEGPDHFINNNYAHFKDRYNNRIFNFMYYLNNANFVTFILCDCCQPDFECTALRAALALKYPNLKYKIIIIHGPHPHKVEETNIVKVID